MFKYHEYQVNIDYDPENINNGIFIELKKQIKLNTIIYSTTITEKYLLEEIKVIKKLDELYNIIIISFNKEKNKSTNGRLINLEIIENNEIDLILKYNIYLSVIDFNIIFDIKLNYFFISAPEIFKKNDIAITDIIEKITDLSYKYDKIKLKYNKLKTEFRRNYPKNKYLYYSTTFWSDFNNPKFINNIINHTYFYVLTRGNRITLYTSYPFEGLFNIININNTYNLKHLIFNNINISNPLNDCKGIHIKKYEITIDIDYFSHCYGIYETHNQNTFDIKNKTPIPDAVKQPFLNSITNFKDFVLNNCTINYLILNQDMYNYMDNIKKLNIIKGIILNKCKIMSFDLELINYCKVNKLDLIIN